MGSTNKELKASKIERSIDRCIQLVGAGAIEFAVTAKELMRDLLPINGAKNMDRYLPAGQPSVGAAGTPPGQGAVPSTASPAVPSNPGISPEVTMEAASTPGMGGMARGLLM